MTTSSLRSLSAPMAFALASIAAGIVGGATTVHGLAAHRGPTEESSILKNRIAAAEPPAGQASASDCDGCSERDLGYHWASIRQIGSASDCPMESWDFQRGCVAYMRDAGGI